MRCFFIVWPRGQNENTLVPGLCIFYVLSIYFLLSACFRNCLWFLVIFGSDPLVQYWTGNSSSSRQSFKKSSSRWGVVVQGFLNCYTTRFEILVQNAPLKEMLMFSKWFSSLVYQKELSWSYFLNQKKILGKRSVVQLCSPPHLMAEKPIYQHITLSAKRRRG